MADAPVEPRVDLPVGSSRWRDRRHRGRPGARSCTGWRSASSAVDARHAASRGPYGCWRSRPEVDPIRAPRPGAAPATAAAGRRGTVAPCCASATRRPGDPRCPAPGSSTTRRAASSRAGSWCRCGRSTEVAGRAETVPTGVPAAPGRCGSWLFPGCARSRATRRRPRSAAGWCSARRRRSAGPGSRAVRAGDGTIGWAHADDRGEFVLVADSTPVTPPPPARERPRRSTWSSPHPTVAPRRRTALDRSADLVERRSSRPSNPPPARRARQRPCCAGAPCPAGLRRATPAAVPTLTVHGRRAVRLTADVAVRTLSRDPRRSRMPEYLTPGVYLEETSFRSRSIEGVATVDLRHGRAHHVRPGALRRHHADRTARWPWCRARRWSPASPSSSEPSAASSAVGTRRHRELPRVRRPRVLRQRRAPALRRAASSRSTATAGRRDRRRRQLRGARPSVPRPWPPGGRAGRARRAARSASRSASSAARTSSSGSRRAAARAGGVAAGGGGRDRSPTPTPSRPGRGRSGAGERADRRPRPGRPTVLGYVDAAAARRVDAVEPRRDGSRHLTAAASPCDGRRRVGRLHRARARRATTPAVDRTRCCRPRSPTDELSLVWLDTDGPAQRRPTRRATCWPALLGPAPSDALPRPAVATGAALHRRGDCKGSAADPDDADRGRDRAGRARRDRGHRDRRVARRRPASTTPDSADRRPTT